MKKTICILLSFNLIVANFLFASCWAKKLSKREIAQKQAQEQYLNLEFWENFKDENLTNAILEGFNNNIDLKIATLKVKESEKIVKLSLGQELPQIDFEPMLGRVFSSGDLRRGSHNYMIRSYRQTQFMLPVEVSYEIDIWGKNRLKTKSKKQSLKMFEQDEKSAYIILTSTLAIDYYNLIKIDKYIELENELLNLLKDYEKIIENKKQIGLASIDDVLEVQNILVQVELTLNELTTKKELLENQIGYLLGDKLLNKIKRSDFNSVIELKNIPQDLNSQIVLNRPDVVSSSENILRANYEARIAKKDLLPTFTITGTFGFNGYNTLSGIFKNHTGVAQIFILPKWNIFDGLRRFNLISLKKLELEQAQKEYEKAVLASIQEVNDSLYVLKNTNKDYKLSKKIYDIQKKKLELKQNNMNFGLANKIDYILYKQLEILANQKYVDEKINAVIAYINLYKACGGVDFSKNQNNQKDL